MLRSDGVRNSKNTMRPTFSRPSIHESIRRDSLYVCDSDFPRFTYEARALPRSSQTAFSRFLKSLALFLLEKAHFWHSENPEQGYL